MKATIEVPDELYRRVKARSALEGRPIRAIVTELLADWLEGRRPTPPEEGRRGSPSPPDWFGSLRQYAHPELTHDMEAIRDSVERARRKESESGREP